MQDLLLLDYNEIKKLPTISGTMFLTSNRVRCSGRLLLQIVFEGIEESIAAFFIMSMKTEIAESISDGVFKKKVRDMLITVV